MAVIGLVTLGQTPRPDHVDNFRRFIPDAKIRIAGALDNLSRSEITVLSVPGDYPLLVKLSDGSETQIPLKLLLPYVEQTAQQLTEDGAHFIVILCAGGFPEIECQVPVLLPGKLLPAVIYAASRTKKIGVVSPVRGQVSAAKKKWEEDGFTVWVTWASPYNHDEVTKAAQEMSNPDIEFVVLDCMGHNDEHRREFANLCKKPVVLTQTLIARIAGEFAGSFPF